MSFILHFVAVEKVLKGDHRIEEVLLKVDRLPDKSKPTINEVGCSAYSMLVSRNEQQTHILSEHDVTLR